jgi:hypothetical protein
VLPDRCGIVVATCDAHASTWLVDCLRSLAGLPVTLRWNTPDENWYDPGALFTGYEAGFDEWWMMPDTVVVTDQAALLRYLGDGQSWALGRRFISCIGKVCRKDVDALPQPPTTKRQAVDCELGWFATFAERCRVIDPTFWDGPERETRHGQERMVLRSSVLTKFKGTWNDHMIVEV